MPVRSTVLQRVLFQIHSCLAGRDVVEESAFLRDRATGQPREVDVVLRSCVGDHEVVVSIEVTETRRRANVEWVERMAAKHASLPTSKLVLVSRGGFSEAALAKAASLGIDAYSIDEAEAADWVSILGEGKTHGFYIWAFRILSCTIILRVDTAVEHRVPPELPIYTGASEYRSTLEELVRPNIDGSTWFTETLIARAEETDDRLHGAVIKVTPPVFIRDACSEYHEIAAIVVYLEIINTGEGVDLNWAHYRGAPIAYGTGDSQFGSYTVSLIQNKDGTPEGAMSFTDPTTHEVRTGTVKFPSDRTRLSFTTDLMSIRKQSSAGKSKGQ